MRMLLTSWIAGSCLTLCAHSETANAGTLMDALINRRQPSQPGPYQVGVPVAPGTGAVPFQAGMPVTANYAPPSNYAAVVANYGTYANPQTIPNTPANSGFGPIPVGVPQTVPAYLPTGSYDTVWNRTPVTYYRPVTAFDPRLGTTVTSLQPCTGFQYQASRVPMVSPQPVLGEYGLQRNQWPGITGPGYNPAGLGVTANYPGYQTLPNSGTFAPYGNSGTSIGMPVSSLPATTFPTAPLMPLNSPAGAFNTSNSIPITPGSVTSYPAYNAPAYSSPTTFAAPTPVQQPGATWTPLPNSGLPATSNIAPATSFSPAIGSGTNAACANGMCPIPNQAPTAILPQSGVNSNLPYIPGATSIQPIGEPTFSPFPSAGVSQPYGTSQPNSGFAPSSTGVGNGAVLPGAESTYAPGYSPSNQPGMGGVADPDSVIQPRYQGANTVQKATTDHLVNSSEATSRMSPPAPTETPLHGGLLPWNRSNQTEIDSAKPAPIDRSGKLEIPSTLPSNENSRGSIRDNLLRAPNGMDTKALWNNDLMNQNDLEARSETTRDSDASRTAKQEDAPIRFISGGSTARKEDPNATTGIYFREIIPSNK
ncbi:hypothetical protein SH449x_002246 [Pirellulaceae bacterium SH449]